MGQTLQDYIDMMGHTFRDRVTKYQGVAESVSFDLYGCVQIALRPPAVKNDKGELTLPDGRYFDASRLEQVGKKRAMEVPTFARIDPTETRTAAPGPADKSTLRPA
jgi:hypothetical protein